MLHVQEVCAQKTHGSKLETRTDVSKKKKIFFLFRWFSNSNKQNTHTRSADRSRANNRNDEKLFTEQQKTVFGSVTESEKQYSHADKSGRARKNYKNYSEDKLLSSKSKTVMGSETEGATQYTHSSRKDRIAKNKSKSNQRKLLVSQPKSTSGSVTESKSQYTHLGKKERLKKNQAKWDEEKQLSVNQKTIFGSETESKSQYSHTNFRYKARKNEFDEKKLLTVNKAEKKKGYWEVDDRKNKLLSPNVAARYTKKLPDEYVFIYGPAYVTYKHTANKDTNPLRKKQIPYDARITGEGNVLVKVNQSKPQKMKNSKLETHQPYYATILSMKQNTNKIERYDGDYKVKKANYDDAHPSADLFVNKLQANSSTRQKARKASVFWHRIFNPNPYKSAPLFSRNKKPKYDKGERAIWQEDTRHPKPKEPQAEID